ncbi:MAG TPA: F0F1 ATP synthase subunit A [Gemmatimonadaceae bacterium]|nr:F0F1 ATP synthase subunit A [Gemmatimonadaceae bacterium]
MRRAAPRRAALLVALLAATSLPAQEHGDSVAANPAAPGSVEAAQASAHEQAQQAERVDIITPHITDAYDVELPYWKPPFYKHVCLGRHVGEHECGPLWDPVHIGGMSINLSPTKHVVMLLVAAALCCAVLITAARAHRRHSHAVGRPKGFAAGIEAMILYIRNEVAVPNLGHHGDAYVPFILTLFFFILFANLLGLIPYGSTATGNIAVTATLAIITFVVIEAAGVRANGLGYLNTIFYWNKDLPLLMRIPMFLIMTPVEIVGKFTKPFALAIRLFANMTAGHIVLLALLGVFFGFAGSGGLASLTAAAPLAMAVAIMLLELFVAFLQAFIFALLASVFIGQIREAHH